MANDAMSQSCFRKIKRYAERQNDLSDVKKVISAIEKDTQTSNKPFLFKVLSRAAIFFIIAILPFYYLLTLSAFIPLFFTGLSRGKDFERSIDLESLGILFQHWGK